MLRRVRPTRKVLPRPTVDVSIVKELVDNAQQTLGINTQADWYDKFTRAYISKQPHGRRILNAYAGSLAKILNDGSGSTEFVDWEFSNSPMGFWKSMDNQRAFMEWLGKRLGVESLEGWYQYSGVTAISRGGRMMMQQYKANFPRALSAIYPNHTWLGWKFKRIPTSFWKSTDNQKRFLEWFSQQDDIGDPNTWGFRDLDRVAARMKALGGTGLLLEYNDNIINVISKHYPSAGLAQFVSPATDEVPSGFNQSSKPDIIDVTKRLGINTLEEWYTIPPRIFRKYKINGIYGDDTSLFELLKAGFPNHEWLEWRFSMTPDGFWGQLGNRERYLQWASRQLGVKTLDDWYSIERKEFSKLDGALSLFKEYNSSMIRMLESAYPNHEFLPWKFHVVPMSYWASLTSHQRFFDWASKQLGIVVMDNWYTDASREKIFALGGCTLLTKYYSSSLINALKAVYPDHDWKEWLFATPAFPNSFWAEPHNALRYVKWLEAELGLTKIEDWYSVEYAEVQTKRCAMRALRRVGGVTELLKLAYPAHEWQEWKFKKASSHYWDSLENQKKFVEWLQPRLNITRLDQWYSITAEPVHKNGGTSLLNKYGGSLSLLLQTVHPDHDWQQWAFSGGRQ